MPLRERDASYTNWRRSAFADTMRPEGEWAAAMTSRYTTSQGSGAGAESEPQSRAGRESPILPSGGTGEPPGMSGRSEATQTGGSPPASRPDPGPPAAGMQAVEQPGSGLGLIVSIAVAALVFVLAIYATGGAGDNRLPLAQTTNPLYWTVALVAVAVAGAGAEYAERVASRAAAAVGRQRLEPSLATAWTLPAIATVAAVLLVAPYHNATMIVAGPVIAFLGNAGALLSRDLLDDATDTAQRTASTIHTLVIHSVAFLAFSSVYLNKMSTPASALMVGVIGGLLTLETLERGAAPMETRLLYSLLAGGVMAQAAAALNWWQTHGWTGGALLLVCFYLASGVLLARTQRVTVRTRDLIEFGAVSGVAFAVLAVTA